MDLLKESTYQTPCGTIHYWSNNLSLDTTTLVFLPGLTADHRLFDKQVEYFDGKYNIIVWDAPAHASSWPFLCSGAESMEIKPASRSGYNCA